MLTYAIRTYISKTFYFFLIAGAIFLFLFSNFRLQYCGAEGFGKAQPIPYQTQDPRWERRNVRGWVRKTQAARRHHRGPSYPQPAKVTEGESITPLKTALPIVPNKRTNIMGQLWGHGRGEILEEAVTSALNARSWQSDHINEEMTPE